MLKETKDQDNKKNNDVVGLVILTLFGYFMAGFAINIVHEAGHGIICDMSGFQSRTFVDERGFHSACTGTPENAILHNSSGGFAGLAVSGVIVGARFAIKKQSVKYGIVALGIGTIFALDQIVKVVLETAFTEPYLSGVFDMPITAFQILSLVAVQIFIVWRHKN